MAVSLSKNGLAHFWQPRTYQREVTMICLVNAIPHFCPHCGAAAPSWGNGERMCDDDFKDGNTTTCPKCGMTIAFIDGSVLWRTAETEIGGLSMDID